jgi:hypothetical protein
MRRSSSRIVQSRVPSTRITGSTGSIGSTGSTGSGDFLVVVFCVGPVWAESTCVRVLGLCGLCGRLCDLCGLCVVCVGPVWSSKK